MNILQFGQKIIELGENQINYLIRDRFIVFVLFLSLIALYANLFNSLSQCKAYYINTMKPLLILLFIITSSVIFGQENELDPVTVTASLKPANLSSTGRNIVVFQGEQIARLPVNSIDELLRYLPGLELQARGPMGSQSDILVRGGTFQQVLVVVDGIRINDPNTGHFNSYIPIAPGEIKRIEVLKGAASAIYGSEAVGGVINIITKTFSAKQIKEKKELKAQAGSGQYGLYNAQVSTYLQDEEFALSAALITNNSYGQTQRGTNGYFHNNTGSISFNYFVNENIKISARTSADVRDFAAQNFYTTFASDTANEKVTTYWNHWKVSYTQNKHNLTFDGGVKNLKDEYQYNNSTTTNIKKSLLGQALIVDNFQYNDNTCIITGLQYLHKKIKSNDRGDHQLRQAALFVQVNHKIGPSLHVSPAMRVVYSENSEWEGVPQLNVSYKLTSAQLRLSAGKTIRDADFTELYNNYNKTLVTSGRIGNPNLQNERSYSYEAGGDYFGIKGLKISGTFFVKYYSRLIDYVNTPYFRMPRKVNLIPTGTYALARNLNKITSVGVEADVQYIKRLTPNQAITAMVGVTNISSRSKNAVPSIYISSHANFLVNFSVVYSIKQLAISVNGLYKEREPAEATSINATVSRNYFVMNALASYLIYKNKLSIFAQADNVFDKSYSDLLGAQMPGRWLMGGLKFVL